MVSEKNIRGDDYIEEIERLFSRAMFISLIFALVLTAIVFAGLIPTLSGIWQTSAIPFIVIALFVICAILGSIILGYIIRPVILFIIDKNVNKILKGVMFLVAIAMLGSSVVYCVNVYRNIDDDPLFDSSIEKIPEARIAFEMNREEIVMQLETFGTYFYDAAGDETTVVTMEFVKEPEPKENGFNEDGMYYENIEGEYYIRIKSVTIGSEFSSGDKFESSGGPRGGMGGVRAVSVMVG